jgi:hypothetical protein
VSLLLLLLLLMMMMIAVLLLLLLLLLLLRTPKWCVFGGEGGTIITGAASRCL